MSSRPAVEYERSLLLHTPRGFPGSSAVNNLPAYRRRVFNPGLEKSYGEGNGNPLQYSCLENPMDREAWRATVHGVARLEHDLATKPPPPVSLTSNLLTS